MNIDPIIEVEALDVLTHNLDALTYNEDRATVVDRPFLVLMLNPICGCVLYKIIEVAGSPNDALAGALSSWRHGSGTPAFVIDDGRDFRSTTLVNAALGSRYSSRISRMIVKRTLMKIIQRVTRRLVGNEDSTHLTLSEIQRRVWKEIAIHNKKIRKGKEICPADPVYKLAENGVSLSVRIAYYNVLQASLECGFDAEQVNFIWQTASYAYPAGQLRMMFEGIVKQFHSTKMYYDCYHTDVTHLQSLFKPPIDILEGEGAGAIPALAYVKAQYDKKPSIWVSDSDRARPTGSWADLTYALLEIFVKDGLATEELRCKLFARDLGL
jgi:hypothetical protein